MNLKLLLQIHKNTEAPLLIYLLAAGTGNVAPGRKKSSTFFQSSPQTEFNDLQIPDFFVFNLEAKYCLHTVETVLAAGTGVHMQQLPFGAGHYF